MDFIFRMIKYPFVSLYNYVYSSSKLITLRLTYKDESCNPISYYATYNRDTLEDIVSRYVKEASKYTSKYTDKNQ